MFVFERKARHYFSSSDFEGDRNQIERKRKRQDSRWIIDQPKRKSEKKRFNGQEITEREKKKGKKKEVKESDV